MAISVGTATLCLAGALAYPVWALLPCAPDWRWLVEREDTPWYPTMLLFRQRLSATGSPSSPHWSRRSGMVRSGQHR